jgi:hypothetical protein
MNGRLAVLGALAAAALALAAPAAGDVPPPHLTTDALLVFLDQTSSPQFSAQGTVRYALRGHDLDDPTTSAWWTIGAEGEADTATPTAPLDDTDGGLFGPSSPDAALTRGGLAMAVWEEDTKAAGTCLFNGEPQEIPRIGHIRFARLDARTLPGQAATWSGAQDAATGQAFHMYLDPSIALDVDGRGLLVWREVEFAHDDQGCITPDTKTRTRYRVWDGQAWQGPADGTVVPGSEQLQNITESTIHSFATRVRFTSTTATAGSTTRQTAVLVYNDMLRQEHVDCSGTPVTFTELWPRTATWDGNAFNNVSDVPGDPQGSPYFQTAPQRADRLGLATDRAGGADLLFQTRKTTDICTPGPTPKDEVYASHLSAGTWSAASRVADGHAPDVTEPPHGDPLATSGADAVEARTASGGVWGAAGTLDAADSDKTTVAGLPQDADVAAWTGKDAGPLRWAQQPDGGPWSAAAPLDAAVAKARNPQLAPLPVAQLDLLFYGAGDNDIGECVAKAVDLLEKVGSSTALSIVAQVDDDAAHVAPCTPGTLGGGGDGAYRAQVPYAPADGRASSEAPFTIAIDEPDMAAGQTLADFLAWAEGQQPADRYVLSLADHGGGWRGLLTDDTDHSYMSMGELRTGLTRAPPLPVLILDACLMGQLEVGYEVIPYADRMVASEDCGEGTLGAFPYDNVAALLAAAPTAGGDAMAKAIADQWAARLTFYSGAAVGAFRLDQSYLDLVQAVHRLGNDLATGMDDVRARGNPDDNAAVALQAARNGSEEVSELCPCRSRRYVDLADLTSAIERQPALIPYAVEAATVRAKLAAACLDEHHGSGHGPDPSDACLEGHVSGLSIYFPPWQSRTPSGGQSDVFDLGDLAGFLYAADPSGPVAPGFLFPTVATGWPRLLLRYYAPVADAGPPAVGEVGDTAPLSGAGSSTNDGALVSYTWDFGARGRDVRFACRTAGTFTVKLTVHDDHEQLPAPENFARTDDDTTTVTCQQPAPGHAGAGGGAGGTAGAGAGALTATATIPATELGAALKHGLPITAGCSTACALDVAALMSRRAAQTLGITSAAKLVRVAHGTKRLRAAGRTRVIARFTKRAVRALRRARRVTLTVRVTATAGATHRTVTRRVTLRRRHR